MHLRLVSVRKGKLALDIQVPREIDEQRQIFAWSKWACKQMPELELLFAIPNGAWLGISTNRYAVINALKSTGLKPGVVDMFWPIARGGYHGLFAELKRRTGGVISEQQEWWIEHLREQGYKVVVAHGATELIAHLTEYWAS